MAKRGGKRRDPVREKYWRRTIRDQQRSGPYARSRRDDLAGKVSGPGPRFRLWAYARSSRAAVRAFLQCQPCRGTFPAGTRSLERSC